MRQIPGMPPPSAMKAFIKRASLETELLTKREVLKKTIPDLIEWTRQWFGDKKNPDTGLGENWPRFFKECETNQGVYVLKKAARGFDSNCGNFDIKMEIKFIIN